MTNEVKQANESYYVAKLEMQAHKAAYDAARMTFYRERSRVRELGEQITLARRERHETAAA